MQNAIPELIAPFRCEVGEGPLWNPDSQLLLWLDIPPGIIYSFDPRTRALGWQNAGAPTGGMTLQDDGNLLLFQDGRVSVLEPSGNRREVVSGLCPGNDRFNDVIADPEGRVFAGAMGGAGRLFRFNLDGTAEEVLHGLGIPNGMGFSPDLRQFYFIDTIPHSIYVFDYDRASGAISRQRVFAHFRDEEGFPDGMTVDADGFIWAAVWFGSRLKRFAPDGSLDREILFPSPQISCPAFGGQDLTDIYVTSANSTAADYMMPPGFDVNAQPRGGDTFRVHVEGIRGRPEFRSRIRFPNR
jgi:D-xylono/L-arabinono-1,4-lactonase